jgi:hypothetical protein
MAFPIIIAKNQTGSPIQMVGLNMPSDSLPASPASVDLTAFNRVWEIQQDLQLRTLVAAGTVVINNGSTDFSIPEGLGFLTVAAFSAPPLIPSSAAGGDATGTLAALVVRKASTDFGLTGSITPPSFSAPNNNFSPSGFSTASVARISSTLATALTGLAGGAGGRLVLLVNVGGFDITLKKQDTDSLAANRFAIISDTMLQPGGAVILRYDADLLRWGVVGAAGVTSSSNFRHYSFSVFDNTNPYREVLVGTYVTIFRYVFAGSSKTGAPTKINAIAFVDGGTGTPNIGVRIIDVTNGSVEVVKNEAITTILASAITDLGTISNIPTAPAVWEVQIRVVSGGGAPKARLSGIEMEF